MHAFLSSWSKWVWLLVMLLVSLLALGLAYLPAVIQQELEFVEMLRTPAALYILSLLNLVLIIGALISLVIERFERPMVILFVAFRIGATAWEYELGRHSDWFLIISILLYLLVGGGVLVFLSGHIQRRDSRRSLQDNGDTKDE